LELNVVAVDHRASLRAALSGLIADVDERRRNATQRRADSLARSKRLSRTTSLDKQNEGGEKIFPTFFARCFRECCSLKIARVAKLAMNSLAMFFRLDNALRIMQRYAHAHIVRDCSALQLM